MNSIISLLRDKDKALAYGEEIGEKFWTEAYEKYPKATSAFTIAAISTVAIGAFCGLSGYVIYRILKSEKQ